MTSTEIYVAAVEFVLRCRANLAAAEMKHARMGMSSAAAYGEPDLEHDPVAVKAREDLAAGLPRLEAAFDLFLSDRIKVLSQPEPETAPVG